MFEARGNVLRAINDNVSFTVIYIYIFFYLNIHRIFLITPRIYANYLKHEYSSLLCCLQGFIVFTRVTVLLL